ncbi:Protein kinase-like domain [Pseudocohnilembus persalinus]|uniref:Protein kinase-like domain n=1 Tax=Pseudocohnilembus persalinus TaxID=266149 RepID=A0A0V0R1I7_PSEPJ|nr:Protein kinase-like domain [Pseudocohnilembus persalinus]|eukprot:KRX08221.1 Protein kinase-like domain [Pseudocohnilembus persalinus]
MAGKKTIGNYTLIKEIGMGSFSRVYFAMDQEKNEYAIKKIPRNPQYIVFQYCKYGDLRVCQGQFFQKGLPEIIVQKIMQQLVSAMKGVREIGIVHRDLKLGNILIKENFGILLADFGFAKIQSEFFMNSYCGTPITMAPEILKRQNYDEKCDIWSLGIITYQLLFGVPPFMPKKGDWEMTLLSAIENSKMNFDTLNISNQNCKDFLKQCLKSDPSKRINYDDLFNHLYIQQKLTHEQEKEIETVFQDYLKRSEEQQQKKQEQFIQQSINIQNMLKQKKEKSKNQTGDGNSNSKGNSIEKADDVEEDQVEFLYKDTELIKNYFEQIPDKQLNQFLAQECFQISQEEFLKPTELQIRDHFMKVKQSVQEDKLLLDLYLDQTILSLRCLQQNLKYLIQNVDLKVYLESYHLFDLPINLLAKNQFIKLMKEIQEFLVQIGDKISDENCNPNKTLVGNFKFLVLKEIQYINDESENINQQNADEMLRRYKYLRQLWIVTEQSHLNPQCSLIIKNLRGEKFITSKLKNSLNEQETRKIYMYIKENQQAIEQAEENEKSTMENNKIIDLNEDEFQKISNINELNVIQVSVSNRNLYNETIYNQSTSKYYQQRDISLILQILNDKIDDLSDNLQQYN